MSKEVCICKMDDSGHIVMPKYIADAIHLGVGDYYTVSTSGDEIIIRKYRETTDDNTELVDNIETTGNIVYKDNCAVGLSSNIVIKDGTTAIGSSAFYNNALTSVTIPDSVTSIGWSAFAHNDLTSVTIPDSVTSIGGGAFSDNPIVDNQSAGIIYVDKWAVDYTGEETDVIIPDGTVGIADSAFYSNSLTSVTIPDSVTSIGKYAFYKNAIVSVIIGKSVTSIGQYAFSYNPNLIIYIHENPYVQRYCIENDIKYELV